MELAPLTETEREPIDVDQEPEPSPEAPDDLSLTRSRQPVPERPTLRLRFNTQESVDVDGNAAIRADCEFVKYPTPPATRRTTVWTITAGVVTSATRLLPVTWMCYQFLRIVERFRTGAPPVLRTTLPFRS